jgi:hypothetical protein
MEGENDEGEGRSERGRKKWEKKIGIGLKVGVRGRGEEKKVLLEEEEDMFLHQPLQMK